MNRRLGVTLLALLLLLPGAALAGRFTPPLPDAELPDGMVTVKVVGKGMSDIKVGHVVTLLQGTYKVKTATSGKNGRAQLDGLAAGKTYTLSAADGTRSSSFSIPAKGGLRFLLFLETSMSTMTGGAQPGPSGSKMPAGHPPTGSKPKADESQGAASMEEAKDLAAGEVQVMVVKGPKKTPVSGIKVVVVRPTQIQVVKGHPVVSPKAGSRLVTDARGQARITLPLPKEGQEASHVFLVSHAELTYRSRGLVVSAKQGHRVTFQIFDRTSETTTLKLSPGPQLLARVTEGSVSFMMVLTLTNTGDAIVHPGTTGLRLPLPEGATGVEVHRLYKELVHVDPKATALYLLTPLPPGEREVRYYFELPIESSDLTMRMTMPLAAAAGRATMLGGGGAVLSGPAVTPSKAHAAASSDAGKLYELAAVAAGQQLRIRFTGLPHDPHGNTTAAVIALACLLALWGVVAAIRGARAARQRQARREELLDRLAALPADKKGKGKRQKLMQELTEIWEHEA